ncbi:hypothetical protein TcCL_NonESM12157 [Trypanosoma cruzi]|nr:hypothetical protein TcCL_NonESM12157 [Trypanosoma cruzi]
MQSFLVECFHSALHDGGEAIAPCPAPIHLHSLEVRHRDSCTPSLGPRAAKKDASVHLAANPAPLRRNIGFRAPTQHERLTLLRCIEDVRSLSTRKLCRRPCMKGGGINPAPEDAVINGLRRVCNIIGIPHSHNRAPPIQHRNFSSGTL